MSEDPTLAIDQCTPIHTPRNCGSPMRVVFFVSGGGGNLNAGLELQQKRPELVDIRMVVADRLGIRALELAAEHGIPTLADDFEAQCGRWPECRGNPAKESRYIQKAEEFHDWVLAGIQVEESRQGAPFDLAVLSYRRIIRGKLLRYFHQRMINQHAGDLTVVGTSRQRQFAGVNPVWASLRAGYKRTRTTTILVRDGVDTGEVLCQGPWTDYQGPPVTKQSAYEHELIQKRDSDWPVMKFALREIALGRYALSSCQIHPDGCKVVYYCGKPLPYGGIDLATHGHLTQG